MAISIAVVCDKEGCHRSLSVSAIDLESARKQALASGYFESVMTLVPNAFGRGWVGKDICAEHPAEEG